MDPHKDFVKVDDAFKQLKESSDDEMPAGAWLRMRDILDASMPVGIAATRFSWRKYLTPFFITLLVGSSAILGYNYLNSDNANDAENSSVAANNIPNNTINAPIPASNDQIIAASDSIMEHYAAIDNTEMLNRKITPSAPNNNSKSTNSNKNSIANNQLNSFNNNNQNTTNNANNNNLNNKINSVAAANIILDESNLTALSNKETNIPLNEENANYNKINNLEQINTEAYYSSNNTINENIAQNDNESISNKNNNNNTIQYNNTNTGNITHVNNTTASSTKIIVEKEVTNDGTTIVKKEDGEWYKEESKEVKAVEINKKSTRDDKNNLVQINDTVNVGYKEVITYIPLTRIELAKFGKLPVKQEDSRIILASSNRNDAKNTNSNITLLKDVKVSRKTYKESTSANEIANKFNNELNRIFNNNGRFYAAMYMGGNYTPLGNADGIGYQLGLAAFMNMGERWALAAELRYVRRAFVNYMYNDKSKLYDVEKNGDIYYGTEEIRDNTYSFKGFSALELPIYLGYEISSRLTVYGGVNSMYMYPLKYQVSKSYTFNDTYIATVEPHSTYLNINDDIDFVPRFGLGYLAGLSFNASKKVGVDFRITQMMIDNSVVKSTLINRIAQAPSFQLSFTYFIGKKENIVYILER